MNPDFNELFGEDELFIPGKSRYTSEDGLTALNAVDAYLGKARACMNEGRYVEAFSWVEFAHRVLCKSDAFSDLAAAEAERAVGGES